LIARSMREHGLVPRRTLLDAGVSRAAITHRLKAGRLHAHHRGVYSLTSDLSPDQQALAAILACGSGAVLSHVSAAAHLRILSAAPGPTEVLREGARRHGPAGIRLHRTTHLPDEERTVVRGVPVTTAARTLLDLAATGSLGRLEIALNEALVLRLASRAELEALATSGRGGGAQIRSLLRDAPGFTRNEAERRLRRLILKAQLPSAIHNTRVLDHEVDAYWPRHRLACEVDGFAAHGTATAFERDRRRDQCFAAGGVQVIRVTWRQLTETPEAIAATLGGALARSEAAAQALAAAARTGGGTSRAAQTTMVKASTCTTMPSASAGIGSPNTTMPPAMQETLAAVEVAAMTGTASPACMPRALV
jgi:very-short-patch-repair endonuclease